MAQFSKLLITEKGQRLITKLIMGEADGVNFTKVKTSEAKYQEDDIISLSEISEIRQECKISKVELTNETAVKITAAFTNTELTEGYFLRAIGLYANDPDEGEILYAVTIEQSGCCYIPAYNGATVSGIFIEMVTTVGSAENVSLEVDPLALVSFKSFRPVEEFAQSELREEDILELFSDYGVSGGEEGGSDGETLPVGVSKAYIDERDRQTLDAAKVYAENYTDTSIREDNEEEMKDSISASDIEGLFN